MVRKKHFERERERGGGGREGGGEAAESDFLPPTQKL